MRAQGDEGLGTGWAAEFVEIAGHRLAIDRAGGILAGRGVMGDVASGDRPQRLKHLQLLVAHRSRLELAGRLHRGQAQQLQEVVLHHVAECTRAIVVIGAPFKPDGLGDGDLHLLDVPRIP